MDLTEGSETSANINQTLGKHPKVDTVNTEHSESLKSRTLLFLNCSHDIGLHVGPVSYSKFVPTLQDRQSSEWLRRNAIVFDVQEQQICFVGAHRLAI
jgi:hypothetical protein